MLLETLLVLRQDRNWLCGTSLHLLPGVSVPLSWETTPADAAVPGALPERGCIPCLRLLAFQAVPVGLAASESAAGRRRQQAVLLLLLLPQEPLSHQIHFPRAHREVSVPGLFWWASTEARN